MPRREFSKMWEQWENHGEAPAVVTPSLPLSHLHSPPRWHDCPVAVVQSAPPTSPKKLIRQRQRESEGSGEVREGRLRGQEKDTADAGETKHGDTLAGSEVE